MPPPLAARDGAERLGIDLASLRTAEDCRRVLATVLAAIARGGIAPAEGARLVRRVCAELCAVSRRARFPYSYSKSAACRRSHSDQMIASARTREPRIVRNPDSVEVLKSPRMGEAPLADAL
jgi:hypothetical protein